MVFQTRQEDVGRAQGWRWTWIYGDTLCFFSVVWSPWSLMASIGWNCFCYMLSSKWPSIKFLSELSLSGKKMALKDVFREREEGFCFYASWIRLFTRQVLSPRASRSLPHSSTPKPEPTTIAGRFLPPTCPTRNKDPSCVLFGSDLVPFERWDSSRFLFDYTLIIPCYYDGMLLYSVTEKAARRKHD